MQLDAYLHPNRIEHPPPLPPPGDITLPNAVAASLRLPNLDEQSFIDTGIETSWGVEDEEWFWLWA